MKEGNKIIATPPGYEIKEQLDARGISQKEFSLRMELSEKHISKLINGEVLLTIDVAIKLENVLGIPASFWLNLENIYREKLKQIEVELSLESDKTYLEKLPYKEMTKLGWINKANNDHDKILSLRQFFEVNRLGLLFEKKNFNVLYRRLKESDKSDLNLLAWGQEAKLKSREIITKDINLVKLKKLLPYIRSLTKEKKMGFCSDLKEKLAEVGVALVLLPYIGGSYIHGATFIENKKIVVALTLRGKDADKFWFSLFHEFGHILLGHINEEYNLEAEKEADEFSTNILIPKEEYSQFIKNNYFSLNSICSFATRIDIDPGIVLGRLQHDGYVSFNMYNKLKKKYDFSALSKL